MIVYLIFLRNIFKVELYSSNSLLHIYLNIYILVGINNQTLNYKIKI